MRIMTTQQALWTLLNCALANTYDRRRLDVLTLYVNIVTRNPLDNTPYEVVIHRCPWKDAVQAARWLRAHRWELPNARTAQIVDKYYKFAHIDILTDRGSRLEQKFSNAIAIMYGTR